MARSDAGKDEAGRFAYQGLDRVIHERARLGILASLAAHREGLFFTDLKAACDLTDGNLSRHLTVLSDAKLVTARKGAGGSRPQTQYRLTADGRRRFAAYIDLLDRIVADANPEPSVEGGRSRPGLSQA